MFTKVAEMFHRDILAQERSSVDSLHVCKPCNSLSFQHPMASPVEQEFAMIDTAVEGETFDVDTVPSSDMARGRPGSFCTMVEELDLGAQLEPRSHPRQATH